MEYWSIGSRTHHSTTHYCPDEAIERNEAYEFFSAACARLFSFLPWFPVVGDSVRFEKFNGDLF
jgi:hypothetical protein